MKTLFDKNQLGTLTLDNRFIRAAVGEKATQGHVNDHMLELYKKLAQGGVGTMITGFTLVDEREKQFPLLAFYNDSFVEGHRKLTELVHTYNRNIILQLVYVGSYVMGDATGMDILAPSVVENLNTKVIPKEITLDQIKSIQRKFADAALRAKNAGYDGIEIHAAHGFLLSQFMTTRYNRRTDFYGGSTQNRARMALETYEAIRKSVGPDFPIWIKINVVEDFINGVTFKDVLYLCKELTARKVDAIEISGAFRNFNDEDTSFFKLEAGQIAAKNKTAIIMTGGNKNYKEMTEILNTTKIAYFGMARPLIKNPALINEFKKEAESLK